MENRYYDSLMKSNREALFQTEKWIFSWFMSCMIHYLFTNFTPRSTLLFALQGFILYTSIGIN